MSSETSSLLTQIFAEICIVNLNEDALKNLLKNAPNREETTLSIFAEINNSKKFKSHYDVVHNKITSILEELKTSEKPTLPRSPTTENAAGKQILKEMGLVGGGRKKKEQKQKTSKRNSKTRK
jgi:hypothetical protein